MTDRIARLDSRALVKVAGPDARPFLQDLLTQDVVSLSDGEVRYGALLSPPGRLLFDLFIVGDGADVLLDVDRDRRDALIQRLGLYRLRRSVDIRPDDRGVTASWPGVVDGFRPDPRTRSLGGRAYGRADDTDATEVDYDHHQRSLGLPDADRDAGVDKTYPIEANLDLLNGIDFRKGCFVGQETASRMKRRDGIRKRMLPVRYDGGAPVPGAEILAGDLRAGEVRSAEGGLAIALVRLDRLVGPLSVDGGPVTVVWPEWWPARDHET